MARSGESIVITDQPMVRWTVKNAGARQATLFPQPKHGWTTIVDNRLGERGRSISSPPLPHLPRVNSPGFILPHKPSLVGLLCPECHTGDFSHAGLWLAPFTRQWRSKSPKPRQKQGAKRTIRNTERQIDCICGASYPEKPDS